MKEAISLGVFSTIRESSVWKIMSKACATVGVTLVPEKSFSHFYLGTRILKREDCFLPGYGSMVMHSDQDYEPLKQYERCSLRPKLELKDTERGLKLSAKHSSLLVFKRMSPT